MTNLLSLYQNSPALVEDAKLLENLLSSYFHENSDAEAYIKKLLELKFIVGKLKKDEDRLKNVENNPYNSLYLHLKKIEEVIAKIDQKAMDLDKIKRELDYSQLQTASLKDYSLSFIQFSSTKPNRIERMLTIITEGIKNPEFVKKDSQVSYNEYSVDYNLLINTHGSFQAGTLPLISTKSDASLYTDKSNDKKLLSIFSIFNCCFGKQSKQNNKENYQEMDDTSSATPTTPQKKSRF